MNIVFKQWFKYDYRMISSLFWTILYALHIDKNFNTYSLIVLVFQLTAFCVINSPLSVCTLLM